MTRWKITTNDAEMLRRMAARERRLTPGLKGRPTINPRMVGGGSGLVLAVMDEDILAGETKPASKYNSADPPVDTGETVDVIFDWLSTETISLGKQIIYIEGVPNRILAAECEDASQVQAGDDPTIPPP